MGLFGLFIITVAVLSLANSAFKETWKHALKYFFLILEEVVKIAAELLKKLVVATKKLGKVIFILWRRYKNGKITKVEYKEEEVDYEDVPEGLKKALGINKEVILKEGDIERSEFEC